MVVVVVGVHYVASSGHDRGRAGVVDAAVVDYGSVSTVVAYYATVVATDHYGSTWVAVDSSTGGSNVSYWRTWVAGEGAATAIVAGWSSAPYGATAGDDWRTSAAGSGNGAATAAESTRSGSGQGTAAATITGAHLATSTEVLLYVGCRYGQGVAVDADGDHATSGEDFVAAVTGAFRSTGSVVVSCRLRIRSCSSRVYVIRRIFNG